MPFATRPRHRRQKSFAAHALSEQLRAWRKRKDLSQTEAALKLNISKRTLQEWEQGRAEPHELVRTALKERMRR